MKKLPTNFSLEKYGLKVRLVNENDADFILSLRANPNRTKFMLTLEHDVENQIKWIQKYKKREEEGLDYYLIYSNIDDKPIGLNRITNIDFNKKTAKASSWIAVEGLRYEPFKMLVIQSEIVFDLLKIDVFLGEVHKKNSIVIKIFKLFDYKFEDNGTEYYHFTVEKRDFLKACESRIAKSFM